MTETITKHEPWIQCHVPAGPALCMAWYDYGFDGDTYWKCVVKDGGGIVFEPHWKVRLPDNYTYGITTSPCDLLPAYMAKKIAPKPLEWADNSLDKFSDSDNGERWAGNSTCKFVSNS